MTPSRLVYFSAALSEGYRGIRQPWLVMNHMRWLSPVKRHIERARRRLVLKVLHALRVDLETAETAVRTSGRPGLMQLKEAEIEIEIEIQFVAQYDAKAGVGFDVGLFAVEAGAKYHNENVHV